CRRYGLVAQATVRAWVNADVTIRLPPGLRGPQAYRPITSEQRIDNHPLDGLRRRYKAYVKQYVDRLSGEPAYLDAGPTASRLVAAANPRLQQKRS
ncbi:MAG TPA: hypothetical protein VGQ08_13585, partial [Nitrospiraceae bacterium]|nr:hypothetical protein [Nitrospiraceae bacterium]